MPILGRPVAALLRLIGGRVLEVRALAAGVLIARVLAARVLAGVLAGVLANRAVANGALGAALAVLSLAGLVAPAQARDVTVTGAAMPSFGRITLQFDQRTKVNVRATNGVLVIGFAEPARIRSEKLAAELSAYVSSVRRDPDDTGLRLALVGTVRPNVLEAGERVLIDLLPPNWVGLPPGLPPEIVADLADRARRAEQKLRDEAGRRVEAPKPVLLRVAERPAITRFVFEPPAGTAITFKETADAIDAIFEGPTRLEEGGAKPKLAAGVKSFTAAPRERALNVRVASRPGYTPRAFLEEGTLVVDLATPVALLRTEVPEPKTPPASSHAQPSAPAMARDDAAPSAPTAHHSPVISGATLAPEPGPTPDGAAPAGPLPRVAAESPASRARPEGSAAPLVALAEIESDAVTLAFPFAARTAAAAFETAGGVTLVFETPERLAPIVLPEGARKYVQVEAISQDERIAVLRLALTEPRRPALTADGNTWKLRIGGRDALPPDAMRLTRATDEIGHPVVGIPLTGASGAHWLETGPDGARLAVVTATGRPQGLPKATNFVEFSLPVTLQGVVVDAHADDIVVALGSGGVVVTRKGGLSLSPRSPSNGGEGRAADRLVLARVGWLADQAGNVYARQNGLVLTATETPRTGRAEARYKLARLLVANGMNEEASGVLALARAEDAAAARRRDLTLLSGIAAVRAGRLAEAGVFLKSDILAEDPEGGLWRAMLDARLRRWPQAAAGFQRAAEIVGLYADDLAAQVRLAAFHAFVETGDTARAGAEMAVLEQLPGDVVPPETHDLAHARLEEASGRNEAALKGYERLVASGGRKVWAEASLRSVSLGLQSAPPLPADAAIERLEVVSAAWRGDDIELGALVELSRLYGQAGRWRDVFAVMRRVNRYFPGADLTRVLHDETALLFERLFLGDLGRTLSSVEALGLYYDFRELAPVGRRGDEIVRRLADRLVELDLLDQATDLLQHQVDKRLSGAARATVAARLAAIHLLNAKPALALATLHATRLAGLPQDVRQFRLLLEAQTLADLSRTELALETIEGETGPDFQRLRMNVLWRARRWREAGEIAESLVGRRWEDREPLSDRDRSDVTRATVAYALADEPLDLGRIRTKFAAKMADSPDAATFETLLQPGAVQTRAFREAAMKGSKAEGLRDLLAAWKEAHPGTLAEIVTAGARVEPGGSARAAPDRQALGGGKEPPPG